MDYKRQMIAEYAKLNGGAYPDAMICYRDSVNAMRKINLAHFNDGDMVEKIIKPYLYKWGRMQRVLGREEFRDWEIKILKLIRSNQKLLNEFRSKGLTDTKVTEFKTDIIACYDSFEKVIGKTAASKVLHLICPDFFPLWDTKIADAYRRERKNNHKLKADSSADYYEFMIWVKNFMHDYGDFLTERDGRTKLKVLDDFLWAIANRPLIVFKEIIPRKS